MDLVERFSGRGLECLCGNLRMAARAVSGIYDRHLAAAGVKSSQMSVLWAVASGRGMTVKELAGRIAMHETTLIRNLRILEREGWVTLKVGSDRRQRLAALTRSGRAVFARALVGWKKAQAETAAILEERVPEANRRWLRLTRSAWRA